MKKALLPQKPPSRLAAIGAGIVGLLAFVALFSSFFYFDETENWIPPSEIEAPTLRLETKREWVEEAGFNLPPAGYLPSLQTAMRDNAALREKVLEFMQKNDAEVFANYRQTDADITAILLLWAGADLNETQKTREGEDPRVDHFIRRVYGMGGLDNVRANPRLGSNPWPRLFAHYKMRLIAQTPGGQAPFGGQLSYDLRRDRLENAGTLDPVFFSDFGRFLKGQKNAAGYRKNLLQYVLAVKGGDFSAEDRKALRSIN